MQLGKEAEVFALGRTWRISKLRLSIVHAWRDWIAEHLEDPRESLGKEWFDQLPKAEQIERVKAAESTRSQMKRFSVQCPLSKEFLGTEEGCAAFGRLMLLEHHPEMTADLAFEIWQEIGADRADKIIRDAEGKIEGNASSPATAA